MPCYVWWDLPGKPRLVGATQLVENLGEFRYAPGHLETRAPALDPLNLPAGPAAFTTRANKGVFGVLADAGPDAWGRRVLLALHPRRMASASGLDLLLQGHGTGALLFSQSRDQVQPRARGIALADLGAAAEGAQHIEQGEPLRGQLRELMQHGTSLGGVHPKIAVTDARGAGWIAKFRSREDIIDTPGVEWATMRLARECGIDAAAVKITAVGERRAMLVRRFDRVHSRTLHYASAHALWNRESAREDDTRQWASYAGLVHLRQRLPGNDVRADSEELFRRLAFNISVGNTDDHGRNHGFLMDAAGAWRLAPAFDLVPSVAAAGNLQALGAGPRGRERSYENLIEGAASFGLNQAKAGAILQSLQKRVRSRFKALLRQASVAAADREAVLARVLP